MQTNINNTTEYQVKIRNTSVEIPDQELNELREFFSRNRGLQKVFVDAHQEQGYTGRMLYYLLKTGRAKLNMLRDLRAFYTVAKKELEEFQ